jgi:hypothetical protein
VPRALAQQKGEPSLAGGCKHGKPRKAPKTEGGTFRTSLGTSKVQQLIVALRGHLLWEWRRQVLQLWRDWSLGPRSAASRGMARPTSSWDVARSTSSRDRAKPTSSRSVARLTSRKFGWSNFVHGSQDRQASSSGTSTRIGASRPRGYASPDAWRWWVLFLCRGWETCDLAWNGGDGWRIESLLWPGHVDQGVEFHEDQGSRWKIKNKALAAIWVVCACVHLITSYALCIAAKLRGRTLVIKSSSLGIFVVCIPILSPYD